MAMREDELWAKLRETGSLLVLDRLKKTNAREYYFQWHQVAKRLPPDFEKQTS